MVKEITYISKLIPNVQKIMKLLYVKYVRNIKHKCFK